MANIFEAEVAGQWDAMISSAPRQVPAQFSAPALADAYLEAFDRMRQSLRGCVPAPPQERLPKIKPPAAAGKTAKAKAAVEPKHEQEPTPQPKPGMDGVLDALLRQSAKEGIAA